MSWEHIDLNMTPGGEMPVVHVSQFDTYRAFTFNLYVGEDEWTIPETARFELHCRKVDDNIVIIEPLSTDTSSVTFITTEQLTACAGKNKCELVAINTDDDSLIVGSINFILDVEADPLAGGVTSETAIDNLTQQIEDIAEQVIGEDYYDKTEVDNLLADKADVSDLPDMSLYYTKTATDTLLNAKADKSDTYTKTQVDTALAAKANTADLATVATTGDYDDLINKPTIPAAQIQSDYAQADNTQVDYIKNKPDIEGMIAAALLAVMPVETQTGNPCSFNTDIAAELHGLTADIVASGGGGTPSTPIPIVGHSELNLVRCGKNLYSIEQGAYDQNMFDGSGNIVHYPDINLVVLPVESGSTYSFMFGNTPTSSTYVRIAYVDANGGFISREGPYSNTQFPINKTMPNNCKFIQLQINEKDQAHIADNDWLFGVIKGSDMPYEPFNGDTFTVSFGQTVYGGVYDANAGKVTITWATVDLGSFNWVYVTNEAHPYFYANLIGKKLGTDISMLCDSFVYVAGYRALVIDNNYQIGNFNNTDITIVVRDDDYTDTATFKTAMNGIILAYELAAPIEIDVSELSVNAIVGANNIVSDGGGDVTASYKVSIQKYIDDNV